ncbi:MAG: hypothetical protein L3J74_07460 [Bacteroidales bacterium]|nr:hypothetical protein [Bacteroidales bacterium]
MQKTLYLLFVLFVFANLAKSQETMLLVTGKKISISDFKINESDYISYKNKKGKIKTIAKQDVFSISLENGKETVLYAPDLSDTAAFSVAQMRDYVKGAYDARTNYKTPWLTGSGFIIGGGSVGLTAAGMNALLIPVLPVTYSAGVGIFKMKKEKLQLPDNLKNNDYYTEGYLNRVNRKRVNHAILGTIIGMAAGTIAVIAFTK